jgi:uncharacterized protein (TIGR03435 family)
MTATLAQTTLAAAGSFELALAAKATIVLGLALLSARLLRRTRASVRALVLAAAFGALLLLPAAALLTPAVVVQIPVSQAMPPTAAPSADLVPDERPFLTPLSDDGAASTSTFASSSEARAIPSLPAALRIVWALGAGLFLVPFLLALWRLRRIRYTGLPWLQGEALAGGVANETGMRRRFDVLVHEEVAAPMTCGSLRPAVLLPADARAWSHTDLRQAFAHELEHVRRGDWLVYLVARTVCALYWFHPLVWIAWRRLCLDTERACDDAVLRGAEQAAYAQQLVSLAQRLSGRSPAVVAMASRGDLSIRVHAVLDRRQPRGRTGVVCAGAVALATSLVVAILAPLEAVGRHQQPPERETFATVRLERSRTPAPRNLPGHGGTIDERAGGQLVAAGVSIFDLVRYAYGLESFQTIEGAREWSDLRLDIRATAGSPVAGAPREPAVPPRLESSERGYVLRSHPVGPLQRMMQALLEERFQLQLRVDSRPAARYRVVRADPRGALGPNLRESRLDCTAIRAARVRGEPPALPPGYVGVSPLCGLHGRVDNVQGGHLAATGMSMPDIVDYLSRSQRGPVTDETGLTGVFDLEVWFDGGHSDPVAGRAAWAATIEQQARAQTGTRTHPRAGRRGHRARGSARRSLTPKGNRSCDDHAPNSCRAASARS